MIFKNIKIFLIKINFELKYSNKGGDDILSINFTLESNDGNVKFVVGEDIKFCILECENEEYKICKGGYDYLDHVEIEKDIEILKNRIYHTLTHLVNS